MNLKTTILTILLGFTVAGYGQVAINDSSRNILLDEDSAEIYIEEKEKKITYYEGVPQKILISNLQIQIDATQAVNDLYNFKFDRAEMQFRWLKQKYSWHPLPYFLQGLSEWWKIMPDRDNEKFDEKFLAYMDSTVFIAENLFQVPEYKIEAAFFMSAAYAFKGRLLSERRSWGKAARAGKNALKYLEITKGNEELSPELLFGDALYNYYSVWIPDNYPLLKPILLFFPKGDKEEGIAQLKEVANNAFYTRTEAQLFLMRILYNEEKKRERALQVSEYLAKTYPDNSYFHRYYARMLYSMGRYYEVEPISYDILAKVDSGMTGYNARTGKYAAFFLAQIHEARRDNEQAKHYYKRAMEFGVEEDGEESGYFLTSALRLAIMADREGDEETFEEYADLIKKNTKNKHYVMQQLKNYKKRKKELDKKG